MKLQPGATPIVEGMVSVIIPTYNQSSLISRAINSVLAQDYEPKQIVVGDDASTDSTPEVLRKYTLKSITVVRNLDNLGRVQNYQRLLKYHACGEYALVLDGDDYLVNHTFLSRAVNQLKCDHSLQLVTARVIITRPMFFDRISVIPHVRYMSGLDVLRGLPSGRFYFCHLATLYRRREAIDLDFYGMNVISSDWESLYRLALGGTVSFLDIIAGVWDLHGQNTSVLSSADQLLQNLSIWRRIFNRAQQVGMSRVESRYRWSLCVSHFALSAGIQIASVSRTDSFLFFSKVLRSYGALPIICFIRPKSILRLALILVGYYTSKSRK